MEYMSVTSSSLSAIAYDDDGQVLGVRFQKSGEYHYHGVPRDVYDGFMTAPSAGIYFDQYVKKAGYPCQKVG
jgi:hypothetical protein